MKSRAASSTKRRPPPTASEAAFERAFRFLRQARDGTVNGNGDPRVILSPSTRRADETTSGIARESPQSDFVERAFAKSKEYLEDRYASIGGASQFHTKIAGVSFDGRQDTIAGLRVGIEVELVREPGNPADPNAIAVRYGMLPLGFINRGIAKHLAPQIDAGVRYRARVESLTGSQAALTRSARGEQRFRGVNLYVWRDADATVARTSGERVLRRVQDETWRDLDRAAERVRAALIGESKPHCAQQRVLERIEAGKNTLAVFGTGRGKSFCFQYPAALRALGGGGKTLVVYPLRALVNDQYEALLRVFDPFGLRIYRANGSISHDEREELFAALREGAWDLVLATPEFIEFHRDAFGERSRPSLVVVDEAHHLYESSHRGAYGRLGGAIAALGNPQIIALTATAADDAFKHVVEELRIDAWVVDPTVRENLHVVDARESGDKLGYLRGLFDRGEKGIVYCNSRTEATKVAASLRRNLGDVVMFYHAGMPPSDRHEVERYFREGKLQAVVATSAFGEGIDLPDVRHVVLYHLNFHFTEFNQQAGRAGRDGKHAEIHLLFGKKDRSLNEYIIDREAPTLAVLRALYKGMRGLSRTGVVRMGNTEIARTLEIDRVDERTVSRALSIFEDAGLLEIAEDDEGRFIAFKRVDGKIDLEQNERYAEGEAERASFARFSELVLTASAGALERIINRPIYPDRIALQHP
jgi:single-stranded-DNA-specific exonuclease